jgi:hypothetical protein
LSFDLPLSLLLLVRIWYFVEYVMLNECTHNADFTFRSGRRHYHGPRANAGKNVASAGVGGDGEKSENRSVDDKDEGVAVSHEITT